MKRRQSEASAVFVVAGLVVVLEATLIALALFLVAKLFEFNLWCIAGKDVPWYADLAGGVVCNGINLPVAVACWIATLTGYPTPFIG